MPVTTALIALLVLTVWNFGITHAQTSLAQENDRMITPYRLLLCGSLLPIFRSGPNLASAGSEVQQAANVPNRRLTNPFILLSLLVCLAPGFAQGQAVVEAAGATSVSATAGSTAKAASFPSATIPDKSKSPHLFASSVQRPEVANRQTLEQNAGNHPGKLLVRSVPSSAQVWVNGMFVGHAPLLLIVAPGKYQVELRGQRMEYAARAVDLLPDESRTVSLTLSTRYPTHASVR